MATIKVFVRWRPLSSNSIGTEEIEYTSNRGNSNSLLDLSIAVPDHSMPAASTRDRSWQSRNSFTDIFQANHSNRDIFNAVVEPILPEILQGRACNFFAYGHSGSGKSHTMIGYNFEETDEFGLCLAAARRLIDELESVNAAADATQRFGLGVRMFEIRKDRAFDLLNERCECFVREGSDGKVYIRGETEVLAEGKVRVRPITTKTCWTFERLRQELETGLGHRIVGSSSVHDQSSRTHAILELEIVTQQLLEAREAVVERQSELVPVGKYATDVYIEEQTRAIVMTGDGQYFPNPEYELNKARIDAAEAEKAKFEARVKKAEEQEADIFLALSRQHPCIGGKLVFVDLAGSEYFDKKNGLGPKQTTREKQEAKQINTDLLALKEVIRARAMGQPRIPYRSSRLTMVLRSHFQESIDSQSAMILTVDPALGQLPATMNTLKYGHLVGHVARAKGARK